MFASISLRVLLACTLFAFSLPAQDEAKLLVAFAKAFVPPPKGKATVADKLAALQATAELDSGKTAEVLVEGWNDLASELTTVDVLRDTKNKEMAELIRGQEGSDNRTLPKPQFDRLLVLKPEIAALRMKGDQLRDLHEKVGERLAKLRRRDSALWLLQKVCGQKKLALPLKLAAAKAVGGAAVEVIEELAAALAKSREPEEQLVLIDAMAQAGKTAKAHATPVIALLSSKEEAVAERAALALAKVAVPEAIGPMIALLARIDGQTRLRVAAALEVLTGQQFGITVTSWQA